MPGPRAIFPTLVLAVAALAQTPPTRFEVASVKPVSTTPAEDFNIAFLLQKIPVGTLSTDSPGSRRLTIKSWSLRQLIAIASAVRTNQVAGPGWLDSAHFEIKAQLPEGTPTSEANAALRELLRERFGLQVHPEKRGEKGYELVRTEVTSESPAPKLTPAEQLKNVANSGTPRGPGSWFSTRHTTMESFAAKLMTLLDRRVADRTQSEGFFDFYLSFPDAEVDVATLNQQLTRYALRLRPAQLETDYIVVDSVSREPTPN